MAGSTIAEFLVRLGFKIDTGSQANFTKSIASATLQAKLLGDAIEATARSVHDAVAAMARDLEQLYFASQRTGAAVQSIKSLQFALTQVGGSADGALSSIENIARFMRNNPAGEGFIRGLGVQTRDANGALRDTGEVVSDLYKRLNAMPSYMANAYDGVLGIDEQSRRAASQGLDDFKAKYDSFVAAAHVNLQKAATDSHAFMVASRTAAAATGVLFDKVAGQLTGPLAAQFDRFTRYLVAHYDQISRGLEAAGKVIIWFAGAVTSIGLKIAEVVGSLVGWFDRLDSGTQHLIEMVGGLLIAWRLLNAGFLATPLGAIIAGLSALFLLIDDYTGWKSGKRSLIDWSQFDGGIQRAVRGFETMFGWVRDIAGIIDQVADKIGALLPKRQVGMANLARNVLMETDPAKWTQSYGVGTDAPAASPAATGPVPTGALAQRQAGLVGWLRSNLGLTPEQAAGITGSATQESGVGAKMQEGKPISGRGGLGLFQWTGPRRVAYEKWSAENGMDPNSMQASLGYFKKDILSPAYAGLLNNVRQQTTAGGASRAFFPFESGGDPRTIYGNRDHFATEALGAYGRSGNQQVASNNNAAPVANMTTTIHVDGSHDPHATANAVASQQQRVAQTAARNLRGVVS